MRSIKVKRWVHTLSVVVLGLAAQVAQADRAYISNGATHTVSVIEVSNNSLVATIPVGRNPGGLATNPAGTRVYVPNSSEYSVSVIDTNTNTVIANVAVAGNPSFVVVNQTGTRAYVTSDTGNTVSTINTSTNTVISTLSIGAGSLNVPYNLAINPAGTRLYVTLRNGAAVSVIDTNNDQLTPVKTVAVGNDPSGITVNPAGTLVYVANKGSGTISMIDTTTNNNVGNVVTGYVCANPDSPPNTICVLKPVYTISGSVNGLVLHPTNGTIYLTNPYAGTVMGFPSYGLAPAGGYVGWLAINSTGTRLYTTSYNDSMVSVIDTATMSRIAVLTSANANINYPRGVTVIHR
ncbi:MAG: YncE family protein [Thiotrichaceae bacterium]|nr:YncE family protein [Thiotrichaceae bacterium]